MNPAVVLYNPPNASPPKSILPLSLLAVDAMLEGHHEWMLVDGNAERDPVDRALETLERSGAAVLGRSSAMPWLPERLRSRVRDFERVLNAYYPTSTNPRLRGGRRAVLRAAGSWRWWTRHYGLPIELRALQRVFVYQRPETTGF